MPADRPMHFQAGAPVQFVRYAGADEASDVIAEKRAMGPLRSLLQTLDLVTEVNIRSWPVEVSPLREMMRFDYPLVQQPSSNCQSRGAWGRSASRKLSQSGGLSQPGTRRSHSHDGFCKSFWNGCFARAAGTGTERPPPGQSLSLIPEEWMCFWNHPRIRRTQLQGTVTAAVDEGHAMRAENSPVQGPREFGQESV